MTNKILLLVFTIVFLSNCGQNNNPNNDPELQAIVDELEAEYGSKLYYRNYPIVFSDDGHNKIEAFQAGVCRTKLGRAYKIIINKYRWGMHSPLKRKALVLHEIMHCSLMLGHVEHEALYGASLMSPYTNDSTACLRVYGVKHCVDVSLKMLNKGFIESIGSKLSFSKDHYNCNH